MKTLIALFLFTATSLTFAGGNHCILKDGIETDNYANFSEYFAEGEPYVVHAIHNDGKTYALSCDDEANKLGKVTNCGPNSINFPIDNKGNNANSNYDCSSVYGFQNAEDVLNQHK